MSTEFLTSGFFYSLIAGLAVAIAAGFLGMFMVMRRMTLVSDALSHVALPGVALAIIFNLNPFVGAFAFLLFAAFLISGIERRTDLPTDAIVGVLFSASLAAGVLLTPEPDLLEALFGNLTQITALEAWIIVAASIVMMLVTIVLSRNLIFLIVAPDLGHVSERRMKTANLIFLIMLAGSVALGIRFVGTLLMGTLTIIPAASAKNIARTLLQFGAASVIFAAISVMLGMAAVYFMHIASGPAVILSSVAIFLLTLIFRKPI
ncbi:MAG: metal ABC transporter permease [Candidatus Sungbacteria bacterium]|uniref:High-affinity zinc uptake system membrane protein ZnuB n=1 Tax=Candidatus Sungiibacteriota bacterium TaxID=2750080 RepID=A0A9D6LS38_9BACT|nr:metal ABC transporter permease [Candidatus Sungbacteria bacterium]